MVPLGKSQLVDFISKRNDTRTYSRALLFHFKFNAISIHFHLKFRIVSSDLEKHNVCMGNIYIHIDVFRLQGSSASGCRGTF